MSKQTGLSCGVGVEDKDACNCLLTLLGQSYQQATVTTEPSCWPILSPWLLGFVFFVIFVLRLGGGVFPRADDLDSFLLLAPVWFLRALCLLRSTLLEEFGPSLLCSPEYLVTVFNSWQPDSRSLV